MYNLFVKIFIGPNIYHCNNTTKLSILVFLILLRFCTYDSPLNMLVSERLFWQIGVEYFSKWPIKSHESETMWWVDSRCHEQVLTCASIGVFRGGNYIEHEGSQVGGILFSQSKLKLTPYWPLRMTNSDEWARLITALRNYPKYID